MRSRIIDVENGSYDNELVKEIVTDILNKKVVIMPSDTVYGFLALPELENKIREIKRRDNKPFLHLISSYTQLGMLNVNYEVHKGILDKYWPGPVTFIMNGKDDTVGVRMPDWDILRDIARNTKSPLISTSVNFSGSHALNDINEIVETFQDLADLIVIDRSFNARYVSTIVDISKIPFKIIREGSVVFNEVE